MVPGHRQFTRDEDVFQSIRLRAPAADQGETTLAPDLAALHQSGILANVVLHTSFGGEALHGARILRRIGRASLSVGRIVEGHANALRLVSLYGDKGQQQDAANAAGAGQIFGVWGADGKDPASIASREGPNVTLAGSKNFCSGLGLVSVAVLPVNTVDGPLLVLADVMDRSRADASAWQVSGMRATLSGRYDVTGLSARIVGRPGDYLREPHFEGGIWRYCALHVGGLEALVQAVRQHILMRGQENDPVQCARFAQLLIGSQTARLSMDAACLAVEGGVAVQDAVAQVLLARQAVEDACLQGIALSERCLGTAAFSCPSEADRIRRDLAFFLRQANLDGKLAQAARHVLHAPAEIGELW